MKLWLAAVLCAGMTLSIGVSAAAAGGNAPNAKSCQKNGWMNLYRSDDSAFASETACTSYGAKGGTYVIGGTLTVKVVVNTLDGTGSAAQDFAFTLTGKPGFSLDDDNNSDATLPDSRSFVLPLGTVTGVAPAGWMLADVTCTTSTGANATPSLANSNASVSFSMAGAAASCTFTYSQNGPDLDLNVTRPGTIDDGFSYTDTADLILHNYGAVSETFTVKVEMKYETTDVGHTDASCGDATAVLISPDPGFDAAFTCSGTITAGASLTVARFGGLGGTGLDVDASISASQYTDPNSTNDSATFSINVPS
jgi:hypothetical protein